MSNRDANEIIKAFKTEDDRVKEILNRGLCKCYKPLYEGPRFLLTGINPSYKDDDEKWPGELRSIDISTACDGYWREKAKQFGGMWENILYLDLFPIRETRQRNGFHKAFRNENALLGNLLEITQSEVEAMSPKLIVHSNKDSMFYWGIKKNTPTVEEANDMIHPWMGYRVRRVSRKSYDDLPDCMLQYDRLELFPLYEIVGFVDSANRINQLKYKETSLTGSFLMEYVMDDRNKKYRGKLYKENPALEKREWADIWEWVKAHMKN